MRGAIGGPVTEAVGAVVEAWIQLRIGKLRVLLSLIGVSVAVAAMTFVIAFGQVSAVAQSELIERWNGRPGLVGATVTPTDGGSGEQNSAQAPPAPAAPDGQGGPATDADKTERVVAAHSDFITRYRVTRWATSYRTPLRLDLGGSPRTIDAMVVSGGYGILHRLDVEQGRWFAPEDLDDMSPSVVVSASVLQAMGLPALPGPVKVSGLTPVPVTYTIVGVLKDNPDDQMCSADSTGGESCAPRLAAYVLNEPYERVLPASATATIPLLEVWAGEDQGQEMADLMTAYFDGTFGHGATQATSNDFGNSEEFGKVFTLVVTGSGVFVMVLGALGLVNISLVTVRQRIHEIGVRRSFGASSGRIFFSIMLESVVATVVAGIVGIALAIVAMRIVPLDTVLGFEPSIRPPFPMSAALIGLAAACGVGALAGIVPALVAVRIRPIDAIRF